MRITGRMRRGWLGRRRPEVREEATARGVCVGEEAVRGDVPMSVRGHSGGRGLVEGGALGEGEPTHTTRLAAGNQELAVLEEGDHRRQRRRRASAEATYGDHGEGVKPEEKGENKMLRRCVTSPEGCWCGRGRRRLTMAAGIDEFFAGLGEETRSEAMFWGSPA
jgi:hypothetical protein